MSNRHFDYLDGWRGLAIVFLLTGHFFPMPGIDLGEFGVNLFFVLSGLLMAGLLFIDETPIPVFYKRRISRIIPALIVFLASILFCFAITGSTVVWREWVAAGLLINNYLTKLGHVTMPVGHIWSLSVEEHSYIVLSLIALICRRTRSHPAIVIITLCLMSISVGIWYFWNPDVGNWNHSEVAAFGIFASALLRIYLSRIGTATLPAFTYPLLLFVGLALHWWSVAKPFQAFLGVGVLALTVNILFLAPKSIKFLLSFPPLRQFGIWSFSIYLWQQPFFYFVQRHGVMSQWAGLALAVVSGITSYYLVEMPARKFLNRTWANEHGTDEIKVSIVS